MPQFQPRVANVRPSAWAGLAVLALVSATTGCRMTANHNDPFAAVEAGKFSCGEETPPAKTARAPYATSGPGDRRMSGSAPAGRTVMANTAAQR